MKKKVLIIENNMPIRFLLQTLLGRTYQVITAAGCMEAMDWLARKALPSLIVANSILPDGKDWELVDYLASSRFYRNIPLIVLSDDTKENTSCRGTALGITHLFIKPFNPLELLQLVNELTLPETNTFRLI